jgi:CubicO group peptidase (beta-lactamase class C family)
MYTMKAFSIIVCIAALLGCGKAALDRSADSVDAGGVDGGAIADSSAQEDAPLPRDADTQTDTGTDAGPLVSDECNDLAVGQLVEWPTDEWVTATPEQMGMDPALLEEALDYAFLPDHYTQGVVVVRGGAIVAERYADDASTDTRAASWEVAASITSALIGIAIGDGLIPGVETRASDYLTEWQGTNKEPITIQSLLWMQSGLDFWVDWGFPTPMGDYELGLAPDVLRVAMDNPVRAEPDARWFYNMRDPLLLGGVIERASGNSAIEYAREKIFRRIGADLVDWWVDAGGQTLAFCCFDAPTRQLAKFGLLFLRKGRWDGEQVVPEKWVNESTTRTSLHPGYAYHWWTGPKDLNSGLPVDLYASRGTDGQRLIIIPSLDLIIVRQGKYVMENLSLVADRGYLRKFSSGLPADDNPLTTNGTYRARAWMDEHLVAPIVNAIDCVRPKVDTSQWPDPHTVADDSALCRKRIQHLGDREPYCEERHGCVCDSCAREYLACDDDPVCRDHYRCMVDNQAIGEWYFYCAEESDALWDRYSSSASLASAIEECHHECPLVCPQE